MCGHMSRTGRVIAAASALLLIAAAWLWFSRPQRSDMAAYVPADSLIYMEANSLPEIVNSIVSSDAWTAVAPAAGIDPAYGRAGWMTTLAGWTGLGSGEAVIFARAQVAVCLLGFSAAEGPDATLKIAPRGALVVETHTGAWRVRPAVERVVGRYARRSLGSTRVSRAEEGGATFFTWVAPDDERKRLVVAVEGTLAVIGNDDSAVRACLAVRRGERPSLAADQQLGEMRARLGGAGSLAFGYSPAGSAAKVVEASAPLFVRQASDESEVQSILSGLLPKLAQRAIGTAAWATRADGGAFVDSYVLRLPPSLTARLAGATVEADSWPPEAAQLLPADAAQTPVYNYREPEAAWLALNAGISTQVHAPHAPLVTLALEAMLKTSGVASPRDFLRAAQPEVATARVGPDGGKVLVVKMKDGEAMGHLLRGYLGGDFKTERIGGAELFVSAGNDPFAASFVGNSLLMGGEEDVGRCLSALSEARTLSANESFKNARGEVGARTPHVRTATSDVESVKSLVLYFARRKQSSGIDQAALDAALDRIPYSISETRVTADGMERRTRSAFGQLGSLVMRLAPAEDGT